MFGMATVRPSLWRFSRAHDRMTKRFEAVAKALGNRIRSLRKVRGWSQEHLADEANMHRTYLWGIERGVRNPSLRHLAQIADALGVSVAALFSADESPAHGG
jgi:ribosome-binding protein aMBF1 (putative translation factor)